MEESSVEFEKTQRQFKIIEGGKKKNVVVVPEPQGQPVTTKTLESSLANRTFSTQENPQRVVINSSGQTLEKKIIERAAKRGEKAASLKAKVAEFLKQGMSFEEARSKAESEQELPKAA